MTDPEITDYEVHPADEVPYEVCDHCEHQEEGGHYCLFHSRTVKNMNINSCPEFTERVGDRVKHKRYSDIR